MSRDRLIESLRRDAEEKMLLIREEVRQESDRIRAETRAAAERLRQEFENKRDIAVRAQEVKELAAAEGRRRNIQLAMEQRLEERVHSLALQMLKELKSDQPEKTFSRLKEELPPRTWKTVRVSPADMDMARTFFPEAEIIPDNGISGGFIAEADDRSIQVNNTFEKRLKRAWNMILPAIFRDIYKDMHGEEHD